MRLLPADQAEFATGATSHGAALRSPVAKRLRHALEKSIGTKRRANNASIAVASIG
jgi:hypothetical protein